MSYKEILKLIICVFICQMAGFVGSFFTTPKIDNWYAELIKPSFNPPDWLFAPVWLTLFCLMGISLYLLIKDGFKGKIKCLAFFMIQLILNASWSIVFFGLESILGGFIIIIALVIFILLTMVFAYKISKISSLILIPYILWVSFALILNFSLLLLNNYSLG